MLPKHYVLLATMVSAVVVTLLIRDFILPQAKGNITRMLQFLVAIHAFRFVGMGMFVPGTHSSELAMEFIAPTAWGDYLASILSIISYLMLKKGTRMARPMVWIFNTWGFADLLYAGYQGAIHQIAEHIGAMYFIFAIYAPLLVASHITIFRVLLISNKSERK